jgi:hypothetical protein
MTTFGQNVGKWKDVEKVFGAFQVQRVIIQDTCQLWDTSIVFDIMLTCVMIMHNMMIENQGLNNLKCFEHEATTQMCKILTFNSYMKFIKELENQNIYFSFQSDLIQNLWSFKDPNCYWNKTWFLGFQL